jgi:hypothetical protein
MLSCGPPVGHSGQTSQNIGAISAKRNMSVGKRDRILNREFPEIQKLIIMRPNIDQERGLGFF